MPTCEKDRKPAIQWQRQNLNKSLDAGLPKFRMLEYLEMSFLSSNILGLSFRTK